MPQVAPRECERPAPELRDHTHYLVIVINPQTLLAFATATTLDILSQGPAVLLSLRNGATHGARAVIWSVLRLAPTRSIAGRVPCRRYKS